MEISDNVHWWWWYWWYLFCSDATMLILLHHAICCLPTFFYVVFSVMMTGKFWYVFCILLLILHFYDVVDMFVLFTFNYALYLLLLPAIFYSDSVLHACLWTVVFLWWLPDLSSVSFSFCWTFTASCALYTRYLHCSRSTTDSLSLPLWWYYIWLYMIILSPWYVAFTHALRMLLPFCSSSSLARIKTRALL